jgi:hypothetical protein
MTLTYKQIKNRGDVWGEIFHIPNSFAKGYSMLDAYAYKRKLQKNNRYYKFTFYVGGFGNVFRRKTKYGKAFIEKQRLKLFYGDLSDKHLRYLWKIAYNRYGNTHGNFLHFMESLIHVAVYRANYAFNVKEAKELVEAGFFEINGKQITKVRRLGELDTFRPYYWKILLDFYKSLMDMKFKFFPPPVHLIPNYRTLTFCYIGFRDKVPYYPVKTDLNKVGYIYYR